MAVKNRCDLRVTLSPKTASFHASCRFTDAIRTKKLDATVYGTYRPLQLELACYVI
jgi:hypothetical protein